MFKKNNAKKERNHYKQEINNIDLKYRNKEFACNYQSLKVMNEADNEFKKRFLKPFRSIKFGRNVFQDKKNIL